MSELEIVPGAGHPFEEPATLAGAARLAHVWFDRKCVASSARAGPVCHMDVKARIPDAATWSRLSR